MRARGGRVILDSGVNMSVGQEPQILSDLNSLSSELGKLVYVISGYRSPAHSVAVGGFADDPHTQGAAADIGVGSASRDSMFGVQESQLRNVGLYRPFYPAQASEVNHVQLLAGGARRSMGKGVSSVAGGGFAAQIKALTAPVSVNQGVPGTMINRAGAIYAGGLTKQINAALGSNATGLGGGGGTSGANQKLGRAMMLAAGWGPDQWPSLKALWTQESGWNSKALNPSSKAAGIPQELGHEDPYAFIAKGPRYQINWGLNYIRGRYGSPAAAEAHERANNWYARGGRIPVAWGGWNAKGTDVMVNRPTVFGAGEGATPERVTITPQGAGRSNVTIAKGAVQLNGVGSKAMERQIEQRLRQFAEEVAAEIEAGAEEDARQVIA
jgi:hypothetical protein